MYHIGIQQSRWFATCEQYLLLCNPPPMRCPSDRMKPPTDIYATSDYLLSHCSPKLHPEFPLHNQEFSISIWKTSATWILLTILELRADQCQAKHNPELHSLETGWSQRCLGGGRGRRVRCFSGTCRLQIPSLDFQLHPQQRLGVKKKKITSEPFC